MSALDPRLHAFRPDLADARLRGRAEAARFIEGREARIGVPVASLRATPDPPAKQVTQALLGEAARVFDSAGDWCWVQLAEDGYVGYAAREDIADPGEAPSHRVAVPSTFLYPAASIKSQPAIALPLNARLAVAGTEGNFARLAGGGFVFHAHLKPLDWREPDFVAVAERFLHVPYLWGGKSVQGLDCSGLVQLALQAAGTASPRDSDQQEEALGRPPPSPGYMRGDLVFWDGHVGIMTDPETLLHANGHRMQVTMEPLHEAISRIAESYGPVTSVRRL